MFAHAKSYEVAVCEYDPDEQKLIEFCDSLKKLLQNIIDSIIRDLNFIVKNPGLFLGAV